MFVLIIVTCHLGIASIKECTMVQYKVSVFPKEELCLAQAEKDFPDYKKDPFRAVGCVKIPGQDA